MFHQKTLAKIKDIFANHTPGLGGLELLKYIGPGFIVTVGFIDPGNWAANMAAGSVYGYKFLWVVSLGTLMLIVIQHNAAHLGIVTGLCLAEACAKFFGKWTSRVILLSAVGASAATAFAELLGAAIGINMLTGAPLVAGAVLAAVFTGFMVLSNSYKKIERWIIAFVALIGLCFIFELLLVKVQWLGAGGAFRNWAVPSIPAGSLPVLMCVLGAVVMPHNIFLHSEIIQSRQWNLEGAEVMKKRLKYEFLDTLSAMSAGWIINSAMMLVAATVFFANGVTISTLAQAHVTLKPFLGSLAATVFAIALLLSGLSSSVTAAMAGASIFAGMFGEPLDLKDSHSRTGALITLLGALFFVFLISDTFKALIWSQVILSIQLPLTVLPLIILTSSKRVMGRFKTAWLENTLLWSSAGVAVFLNVLLLADTIRPGAVNLLLLSIVNP